MALPKLKTVHPEPPRSHLAFSTGCVLRVGAAGDVTVDMQGQILAASLATHVPAVFPGQRVVVMHGGNDSPLISSAYPLEVQPAPGMPGDTAEAAPASSVAAMSFDPATGTLSIHAKQLNLEGMANIEIRCGESLLRFNAQGEVFMQAEAITQSAIGPYRIEGASIDLN